MHIPNSIRLILLILWISACNTDSLTVTCLDIASETDAATNLLEGEWEWIKTQQNTTITESTLTNFHRYEFNNSGVFTYTDENGSQSGTYELLKENNNNSALIIILYTSTLVSSTFALEVCEEEMLLRNNNICLYYTKND